METKITSALPFTLHGIDGKNYSLESFKDARVLVILFASVHCPYVHAYEDRLIQLQSDYGQYGVRLVAINCGRVDKYTENSLEGMKFRAQRRSYNFLYLHDATQEIAKAYGVTAVPEVFVFDAKRALRYSGKIDDSWSAPYRVNKSYLKQALQAVLSDKPIPVPVTSPIGCKIFGSTHATDSTAPSKNPAPPAAPSKQVTGQQPS